MSQWRLNKRRRKKVKLGLCKTDVSLKGIQNRMEERYGLIKLFV